MCVCVCVCVCACVCVSLCVCVCAGTTYILQRIQSSKKQNCMKHSLLKVKQFVNYKQQKFGIMYFKRNCLIQFSCEIELVTNVCKTTFNLINYSHVMSLPSCISPILYRIRKYLCANFPCSRVAMSVQNIVDV